MVRRLGVFHYHLPITLPVTIKEKILKTKSDRFWDLVIYMDSGRHFSHARPRDILCFEKPGYETKCYEIGKKLTLNAQMYLANE